MLFCPFPLVKLTYLCLVFINSAGQSFQYATSLAAHYVDCELCHLSCALDGEWCCVDKWRETHEHCQLEDVDLLLTICVHYNALEDLSVVNSSSFR